MLRFALLALLAIPTAAHADERKYMLSGFDRVRVEGSFDVVVTSGVSPGAIATGETRSLDLVNVRVEGRTLVVSPGVNAWGGYPGTPKPLPRIAVRATMLRSAAVIGGGRLTIDRMAGQRVDLSLSGAGSLVVGRAQADRLDATLIGTGSLTVGGSALRARFQSNGAGTIDAAALDARALTVNAQGSGDASFAARETAEIIAEGQGAVRVAGSPACTVRGSAAVICGAGK